MNDRRRVLFLLTKDDLISQGWKQATDLVQGDRITAIAVINKQIESIITLSITASDSTNRYYLSTTNNAYPLGIQVKNYVGNVTGASYASRLQIGALHTSETYKYVLINGATNSSSYKHRLAIIDSNQQTIFSTQSGTNTSGTAQTNTFEIVINTDYSGSGKYGPYNSMCSEDAYIPFYFNALYCYGYNNYPMIVRFQNIIGINQVDDEVFFFTDPIDWLEH